MDAPGACGRRRNVERQGPARAGLRTERRTVRIKQGVGHERLRPGQRDGVVRDGVILLHQRAARRDAEGQRVARPVDEVRAVADGGPEVRAPGQGQAAQAEGYLHRVIPLRRLASAVCRQDRRQFGEARLCVLRERDGHRAAVDVEVPGHGIERMCVAVESQVIDGDAAAHLHRGRIVGQCSIGSAVVVGEVQRTARALHGIGVGDDVSFRPAQLVGGDGIRSREPEVHRLAVEDGARRGVDACQGIDGRGLDGLCDGH